MLRQLIDYHDYEDKYAISFAADSSLDNLDDGFVVCPRSGYYV